MSEKSNYKPIVFYVDDVKDNHLSMNMLLQDRWTLINYEHPDEALKALADQNLDPAILLCDQKMPEMTGVQFFMHAKEFCPDSSRVLITGYSEESLVIDSIARAKVHEYLKKPCEEEEIQEVLQKAYNSYLARKQGKRNMNDTQLYLDSYRRTTDLLIEKHESAEKKAKEAMLKADLLRRQLERMKRAA
jgi:response regulator RpfG family c-di-GMP phosphodiesterase